MIIKNTSGSRLTDRSTHRIASIDAFRALTMGLMIFVNDLWTLKEVPVWLEHAAAQADAMGLSDVVFPAFLFIVGLSIPFALKNRIRKGQSTGEIVWHIISRSAALLVMGVLHVNLENFQPEAVWLPKAIWQIMITIGFFLIWNNYSGWKLNKKTTILLQGTGWIILIIMAIIFRGGEAENPVWIKTYWWGILGLIGWAYLLSSLIYLIAGNRLSILFPAWLFFIIFNIADFAGWLENLEEIRHYVWIVGSGSMPAFTMGGVVASGLYMNFTRDNGWKYFLASILLLGIVMLIFGFAIRPLWGISKIRATPAWIGICTGISFITYGVLYIVMDRWNRTRWYKLIKPAGTATLTCYLLPYIHYALYSIIGISLPVVLRTGFAGILKSIVYALVIIFVTGLLSKIKIRLRI